MVDAKKDYFHCIIRIILLKKYIFFNYLNILKKKNIVKLLFCNLCGKWDEYWFLFIWKNKITHAIDRRESNNFGIKIVLLHYEFFLIWFVENYNGINTH